MAAKAFPLKLLGILGLRRAIVALLGDLCGTCIKGMIWEDGFTCGVHWWLLLVLIS